MTRSPLRKRVTPASSSVTMPAISVPGISGSSARFWCRPAMTSRLAKLALQARTSMRTAPGNKGGGATSSSRVTPGPPNCLQTTAFMQRSRGGPTDSKCGALVLLVPLHHVAAALGRRAVLLALKVAIDQVVAHVGAADVLEELDIGIDIIGEDMDRTA